MVLGWRRRTIPLTAAPFTPPRPLAPAMASVDTSSAGIRPAKTNAMPGVWQWAGHLVVHELRELTANGFTDQHHLRAQDDLYSRETATELRFRS